MKTDTDDKRYYVVRYTTGTYYKGYGDDRQTECLESADKFYLHVALAKAKQLNCNCTVFEYIPPQLGNLVNPKKEILDELNAIAAQMNGEYDQSVPSQIQHVIELVDKYMQ
jgi:hypothetical protein